MVDLRGLLDLPRLTSPAENEDGTRRMKLQPLNSNLTNDPGVNRAGRTRSIILSVGCRI